MVSDSTSKWKNIYIFEDFQKINELKIDLEGLIIIDQKAFHDNYIDFDYMKKNKNLI